MGSSGGVVPPVKEYWPKIREICTRNDVLLIADEVMTGFGRTGRRFGVDHWDVMPDILIGGKGLTGGYMPMGMIAVKESLVEEVEEAKAEFMFYTYSSHPLACAVADEVLAIMERERLVERSAEVGARLGASLRKNCRDIRWSATFAAPECSGGSSWCRTRRRACRLRPRRKSRIACSARRSKRAVLLSGDRDGGQGGRRRDDDHAAVHHR